MVHEKFEQFTEIIDIDDNEIVSAYARETNLPEKELLDELLRSDSTYEEIVNLYTRRMREILLAGAARLDESLPLAVKPGEGWGELLDYLVSIGFDDTHDVVKLLSSSKVIGTNGQPYIQYSLDDSFHLVGSVYRLEIYQVVNKWQEGTFDSIRASGPGNSPPAKSGNLLQKAGKILRYDNVKKSVYHSVLRKYFYLQSPWKAYDIPCGSMGWRMGAGEDYIHNWHDFITALPEEDRLIILNGLQCSDEWKVFVDSFRR